MDLTGRKPTFRKQKPHSNGYRMLVWGAFIVMGVLLAQKIQTREIKSPFDPTPTPTRTFESYEREGMTYFQIGKLECLDPASPKACAIEAYRSAIAVDPNNARLQSELARIMVYSSALLTTNQEKLERLQDAQQLIDQAATLNPDDSYVHAVYAFVLDWLASVPVSKETVSDEQRQDWLTQAANQAVRAVQLDEGNILALSYYSEILVDQQKWGQAEEIIRQAALREDPTQPIMDLHRVYGYVLENQGKYNDSITEYKKASEINPKLTFLYLNIGNKYRYLGTQAQDPKQVKPLIEEALSWFERAVKVNEELSIHDPLPYLYIANTYANQGEFFSAVRNVRKALELNPTSPEVYAQLGMVYHRSRNYEGSIPAFQCALEGCDEILSCEVRQCDPQTSVKANIESLPLDDTTVFYYATYGSVLAALDKPSRPYCDRAVKVLAKVKEKYSDQPDISGIIRAGEDICAEAGVRVEP